MLSVPEGFERVRRGFREALARRSHRDALWPLIEAWAAGTLRDGRALAGGRGGVAAYDVPGLGSVVLRPCRRGGLVRHLSRELYLGATPRPFREVAVAAELARRGVPTLEMLAGAVQWRGPLLYRGAVLSREVGGAINLWDYLTQVAAEERERMCVRAAQAARRLHDAGAVHPDLNLKNFLVRPGSENEVRVIDYDRVVLRPVTPRDRQRAFARICRSIRRLDPIAEVLTLRCIEALREVAG